MHAGTARLHRPARARHAFALNGRAQRLVERVVERKLTAVGTGFAVGVAIAVGVAAWTRVCRRYRCPEPGPCESEALHLRCRHPPSPAESIPLSRSEPQAVAVSEHRHPQHRPERLVRHPSPSPLVGRSSTHPSPSGFADAPLPHGGGAVSPACCRSLFRPDAAYPTARTGPHIPRLQRPRCKTPQSASGFRRFRKKKCSGRLFRQSGCQKHQAIPRACDSQRFGTALRTAVARAYSAKATRAGDLASARSRSCPLSVERMRPARIRSISPRV